MPGRDTPKPPAPEFEERLAALEARNRDLEAEVARMRRAAEPPKPKPPQELPGQGPRVPGPDGMGGMTGQHYCGAPSESTTSTGGGSHSFNPWRTGPNGEKIWAPDGVARNPLNGEALATRSAQPVPIDAGPPRSVQHQQAITYLDRMFPVGPAPEG